MKLKEGHNIKKKSLCSLLFTNGIPFCISTNQCYNVLFTESAIVYDLKLSYKNLVVIKLNNFLRDDIRK